MRRRIGSKVKDEVEKDSDPRRQDRPPGMRDASQSGKAGRGAVQGGEKRAQQGRSGLEDTTAPGRRSKHAGERNMATHGRGAREEATPKVRGQLFYT